MLVLWAAFTTGCSAAGSPQRTPESPVSDLAAKAFASYAVSGYELGVTPTLNPTTPDVCPYEVASWDKSLTSSGVGVLVNARGSVVLTATATTPGRATATQKVSVSPRDAMTTIDLPDSDPTTVTDVVVSATNGAQGRGGSCRAARPSSQGTGNDYCHRKPAPLTIPTDAVGLQLSDATTSLREFGCFDTFRALSTDDGHDVTNDPANSASRWTVVAVDPKPGSTAGTADVITARVTRGGR